MDLPHLRSRQGLLLPAIPFISDLENQGHQRDDIALGALCIPQSLSERDLHPLLSSRQGGVAEALLCKQAQRVFSEKHFSPVLWASLGGWNTEQYRSLGFVGYGFRDADILFDFPSIATDLKQRGSVFLPEIQATLALKNAYGSNPELQFNEIKDYRCPLPNGFSQSDLSLGIERLVSAVIDHATSDNGQLFFEVKPSQKENFFLSSEMAKALLPELQHTGLVDKTIREKGWHTDFYLKPSTFSGKGRAVLRVRYNHSFMRFEFRDPELAIALHQGLSPTIEPCAVSHTGQTHCVQYRARTLQEAGELLYRASRFLAESNESFLILEDTIPLSITKNGFRPEVRVILQKRNASDEDHLVTADYAKMGAGVTANIAQGSKGLRTDRALDALFAHTFPKISRQERKVFLETTISRIHEASKATAREYGNAVTSICRSLPPFLAPGMLRYGLPDIAVDVGIHIPPYCPTPDHIKLYCIEINEMYACNGAGLQTIDRKAFDRVMRQRRELHFQMLLAS